MVTFPILMPSSGWMALFLKEWIESGRREDAIEKANSNLVSPREFGRYAITTPGGNEEVLSVAVAGGGRRLRHWLSIEETRLSEHGDWRKLHLAALDTCLGRKPFYRDLEPSLKEVYANRELVWLKDFNSAIFERLLSFLMGSLSPEKLVTFFNLEEPLQRGAEIMLHMPREISIVESLATFGRETLLGLLSMQNR